MRNFYVKFCISCIITFLLRISLRGQGCLRPPSDKPYALPGVFIFFLPFLRDFVRGLHPQQPTYPTFYSPNLSNASVCLTKKL